MPVKPPTLPASNQLKDRKPWKKKSPVEVVLGAGRQIAPGDRRGRRRSEAEAQATAKIRRGQEDFRSKLTVRFYARDQDVRILVSFSKVPYSSLLECL